MRCRHLCVSAVAILWAVSVGVGDSAFADEPPADGASATPEAVPAAGAAFSKTVLPLFQTKCQGCHQAAKPGGGYVMTSAKPLFTAGESGETPIVPGNAEASYLFQQIRPDASGHAEMPKDASPLTAAEIEMVRSWIDAGAVLDGGMESGPTFTPERPPTYVTPPLIPSLDISPDGSRMAVAGYHEVLVYGLPTLKESDRSNTLTAETFATWADGVTLERRLVGLSERVESVRFSPDGTRLAAAGGKPCVFGEVQIWNVADGTLDLSVRTTHDTVGGLAWSPDGTKISYGGYDKSVRAIDVATGTQVLYNGTHDDFVLDTAFSADGQYVISGGRDMTVKLTELATQRFIDNITSITPGALRGGVSAVCAHPQRPEIVIGGADGSPQVFRIHRETERKIGDNANLIRALPTISGRINDVALSSDAQLVVSGASLDGRGEVAIDAWDFTGELPDELKKIMSKRIEQRSADDNKKLQEFHTKNVKRIAVATLDDFPVYSVAVEPSARYIVVAGMSGRLACLSSETGALLGYLPAFPMSDADSASVTTISPENATLEIVTPEIATEPVATELDVTQPVATREIAGAADAPTTPDFIRDVNPVLSRMGCNAGTCHGAAKGKNGFKLSLRGYDALFDVRSLTDDLAGRRINLADPDASLMLRKMSGGVPHVGGVLAKPDEPYYQIVRAWIAAGAKLNLEAARVTSIAVTPENPTLDNVGDRVVFAVTATYADGTTRDVTRDAFVETGNGEVAVVEIDPNTKQPTGRALRRGEAPFLARYEGAYAATTVTVMGDRDGFVWQDVPTWGTIDELVAAKWQRMKIRPSELCTDEEFLRRVTLDLTGLPPAADELTAFLADTRDTQVKRQEVIDRLIGSPAFVDYWSNKWADLLQVNPKFLGDEGSKTLRGWIRAEIEANTPIDELARKIITASGSNRENPAASYYKVTRNPDDTLENTTHLFLGVRFNCNKCHDHPFERWTQDQYFETAAFFAGVKLDKDPESKDKTIGGTAVEGAKPLYEIVRDDPQGTITHERTGTTVAPAFPYEAEFVAAESATPRERFAAWMTSPDNRYFARSWANRMWGYLLGVGLIEPIDDIRAGNPPTNPELLDHLTERFIADGFDVRKLVREIVSSRTYQLSLETNAFNADDVINFSHALPRRLPAEVIFDTVHTVTGTPSAIPGEKPGTRAVAVADASKLPGGFLATLGKPVRESVCECERSTELQLGPVMALISGDVVARAIESPEGKIPQLVETLTDDKTLVDALTMRVLSRHATDADVAAFRAVVAEIDTDHAMLIAALDDREKHVAATRPALEAEHQAERAAAEAKLAARRDAIAPERDRLTKERSERIAAAEAKLAEATASVAKQADAWLAKQGTSAIWTTLRPQSVKAEEGVTFTVGADGAILVDGGSDEATYTLTFDVGLSAVTAIRLEALHDDRLPAKGPGLAPNGNFVLNELVVEASPITADGTVDPKTFKPVKLKDAQADFSQDSYPIANAANGNRGPRQGWAVSPSSGKTHWATFQLDAPLAAESGHRLRITMPQRFGGKHRLGKFRLAVTGVAKPIGLSLSDELLSVAATPATNRTEAQTDVLVSAASASSDDLKKAREAVAAAKKPLDPDAEQAALEKLVTELSKPLPEDRLLVQLRSDVAASEAQRERKRLTAAQDFVWAMMNSPGFLFNR